MIRQHYPPFTPPALNGNEKQDILLLTFRHSVCQYFVAICSLTVPGFVGSQSSPPKRSASNLREIQQQYQKLVLDLYGEEAKIQQKRAAYGKKSIDDIQETIDNLLGIIKITPPNDDPGENLPTMPNTP